MPLWDVYISKAYFPRETWAQGRSDDVWEMWRGVKANSPTEAAKKVWAEHGARLLPQMNPDNQPVTLPMKVSLFVGEARDMKKWVSPQVGRYPAIPVWQGRLPKVAMQRVTPEELEKLRVRFAFEDKYVRKNVEEQRDVRQSGAKPRCNKYFWKDFIVYGSLLSEAILGTKKIPPGMEKPLELAARLFMSTPRCPQDIVAWYDLNEKKINLLLDASYKWADRIEGEEGEQTFKLGPFTIVNTLGLNGTDLDGVKDTLGKVIRLTANVPLRDFHKVLYGEIYLVGKLQNAKTLAWYYISEDYIHVRPFTRYREDFAQALIHELAHRYWKKFMDLKKKVQWTTHHSDLIRGAEHAIHFTTPKPGDKLPDGKSSVTVKEIKPNNRGVLSIYLEEGGLITLNSYWNFQSTLLRQKALPTPYSVTNSEEHFCEATALLATGKLDGEHKNAYMETLVRDQEAVPEMSIMRTASTYVQISREELEEWMSKLPLKGEWKRKENRAGVYLLPLSDSVGVQLNSTIGSKDDAMGRGAASMKLFLVSLVTGQPLNKKAMGQSHFNRTTNWRQTWVVGFDRMRDAYMKAQGFYDALAVIEDREKYQKEMVALIETHPTWQNDPFLKDLHERVSKGGILTTKQKEAVERAIERVQHQAPAGGDEVLIKRMRDLYIKAKMSKDEWLMSFLTNVAPAVKAGRPLSQKQQEVLDKNFARHKVALYRRAIHNLLS